MTEKKMSKIRWIFPLIHFLSSFITERFVFRFDDLARVPISIPLNNAISDSVERAVAYCISKFFAAIIISVLWYVFYLILDKKVPKKTVYIFLSVLLISYIRIIFQWPSVFVWQGDNQITYSYALRFMPEYWHSIFCSSLYSACMMVLPHSISICIIQCTFFVLALACLYNRIDSSKVFANCNWVKYGVFLLYILRDSFSIMSNPWRTEQFAVLFMFYVIVVSMDIVEQKKRPLYQMVFLGFLAVFLADFRVESILVSMGCYFLLILLVYKPPVRLLILYVAILVAGFWIVGLPQKMGNSKYYGKDYVVINSFANLRNILNNETSNLNYEGVDDDLNAIEAICPIELIKMRGVDGYRDYNYSQGRLDFNQSAASSEDQARYIKAYGNIIRHNIPLFAKTQMNFFLVSMDAGLKRYKEPYTGSAEAIDKFGRDLFEVGIYDVFEIRGYYRWVHSTLKFKVESVFSLVRMGFWDFVSESRIYLVSILLEIVVALSMMVVSFIDVCKKKYDSLGTGILILLFAAYFWMIVILMPEDVNSYFHACFYGLLVVMMVSIPQIIKGHIKTKVGINLPTFCIY